MKRKSRNILTGLGISLFFLTMIYLYGVFCFSVRFPFRTFIDGSSVFLQTRDEVSVMRMTETANRTFVMKTRSGVVEQIPFSQLGIRRKSDLNICHLSLSGWTWPQTLFVPTYYEFSDDWVYHSDAMRDALDTLCCVDNPQARKSSDLYLDTQGENYVFIRQDDGTEVDTDRLFAVMKEHIEKGDFFIDLVKASCYRPFVSSDSRYDKETAFRSRDFLEDCHVTLLLDSGITEDIPDSVLSEMVYEKSGKMHLYWNIAFSYAGAVGKKYNTTGMDRRFETHDGKMKILKASKSDSYVGYKVDEYDLAVRILDAVAKGGRRKVRVPWYSKGAVLGNKNTDIGNTYFELDLKEQHLWLYVDGVLIEETPVTTGLDTKERRTKPGLYQVMHLYTHYKMYYDDGDSESEFFIKISPDGIGIHDASWRSEFGKSIYKTDGSHGCINVPYESEVLFFHSVEALSQKNIPVIIY